MVPLRQAGAATRNGAAFGVINSEINHTPTVTIRHPY